MTRITIVGGPTAVLDYAGLRLVVDPTFDAPGEHGYLTKTRGPAWTPAEVGTADVVLVSHDLHPDNLDTAGRAYALAAPLVVTGPETAARLGPPAVGIEVWQSYAVPGPEGSVSVTVLPAVHGPEDGERDDAGHVNCEVSGFLLSAAGQPTVYLSGDNASVAAVVEIVERLGPVDVAVINAGAARVAMRNQGRALTMDSVRVAAAAAILRAPVVPAHYDGWAHFSEGAEDLVAAFEDAGLSHVLRLADLGSWVSV